MINSSHFNFFSISILLNMPAKTETTSRLSDLIHQEHDRHEINIEPDELAARIDMLRSLRPTALLPKRTSRLHFLTFGISYLFVTLHDQYKAQKILKEKEELTTEYLDQILKSKPTPKNLQLLINLLDPNNPKMTKEILKYALDHNEGTALHKELIQACRKLPIENSPEEIAEWKTLFLSPQEDSFEKMETLLLAGIDIHLPIDGNKNALQIACKLNSEELLETLINAGADLRVDSQLVMEALIEDHLNTAAVLIDAGVDLNVPVSRDLSIFYSIDNNKALSIAIAKEQWSIVHALIETGRVDLDAFSQYSGHTPLTLALENNAPDAILFALLKAGADPNLTSTRQYLPLWRAASAGRLEIVKALIQAGAKLNTLSKGNTALTSAVMQGHQEVALYLIEQGAVINKKLFKLEKASTLLSFALDQEASEETVLKMLQAGANAKQALISVAGQGKLEKVKMLIQAGTQPSREALAAAILQSEEEIARYLIQKGAPIDRELIAKSHHLATLSTAMMGELLYREAEEKKKKLTQSKTSALHLFGVTFTI